MTWSEAQRLIVNLLDRLQSENLSDRQNACDFMRKLHEVNRIYELLESAKCTVWGRFFYRNANWKTFFVRLESIVSPECADRIMKFKPKRLDQDLAAQSIMHYRTWLRRNCEASLDIVNTLRYWAFSRYILFLLGVFAQKMLDLVITKDE